MSWEIQRIDINSILEGLYRIRISQSNIKKLSYCNYLNKPETQKFMVKLLKHMQNES